MQPMTKKAFVLLEMVVVVFIIAIFTSISFTSFPKNDYAHYYFMDEYLKAQSEALVNNEARQLESDYDFQKVAPIRFTADGTVNMAQTLIFDFAKVIIHLGNGSISYD